MSSKDLKDGTSEGFPKGADERARRLASALRENLHRRKAQSRNRKALGQPDPHSQPDPDPEGAHQEEPQGRDDLAGPASGDLRPD